MIGEHIEVTTGNQKIWAGGEVHAIAAWQPCGSVPRDVKIVCRDYSAAGFMALCQVAEIVRRNGATAVNVVYPYFPYARQDRPTQRHEPFSLKTFASLVNSQGFDSVLMLDPHSDVAPGLIERSRVIPQWVIAARAIPHDLQKDPTVMFVSPDAGAYKKLTQLISSDGRICIGAKIRGYDGGIASMQVFSPVDLEGRTCVIVDDIADGGRTFIELAQRLRSMGAVNIRLYVTHGIFCRGFYELSKNIDAIYTTNSVYRGRTDHEEHPGLLRVEDIDTWLA